MQNVRKVSERVFLGGTFEEGGLMSGMVCFWMVEKEKFMMVNFHFIESEKKDVRNIKMTFPERESAQLSRRRLKSLKLSGYLVNSQLPIIEVVVFRLILFPAQTGYWRRLLAGRTGRFAGHCSPISRSLIAQAQLVENVFQTARLVVLEQILRRILGYQTALLHEADHRTALRLFNVVRCDYDGYFVVFREVIQQTPDSFSKHRITTDGWFICGRVLRLDLSFQTLLKLKNIASQKD